jgi:hypothetical protein
MDAAANGVAIGANGGEVALNATGAVTLTARVACLLPDAAPESGRPDPLKVPYWTPEHARIGRTRRVEVEAIVNGVRAAAAVIDADGGIQDVRIEVPIERSSWVALRIRGCAHTNPFFVIVAGRPVRASRRSAEWCLASVDRCWSQKGPRIRARERDAAARAYEHARGEYRRIAAESA